MTNIKGKILFIAVILSAFLVPTVFADWETVQISDGADDGIISTTGFKNFDNVWVPVKDLYMDLNVYFCFRNVQVPKDALIKNAFLELQSPPQDFQNITDLSMTIYGLRTPNQPTWDPTPDLNSQPFTGDLTNVYINDLKAGNKINITVTGQVKEIIELHLWVSGQGIGFRGLSIAEEEGSRYALAYEHNPSQSAKLYIEYETSTNTTTFYKDYEITENPATQFKVGTILGNSSADGKFIYPDPAVGALGLTDPTAILGEDLSLFKFNTAPAEIGFIRNDRLFLVARDSTVNSTLNLHSAPLSNLNNWTKHAQLTSFVGVLFAWDIDVYQDTLHLAYSVGGNSLWYVNCSLTTYIPDSTENLYSGGVSPGNFGITLKADSTGGIWIGYCSPKLGTSSKVIVTEWMPSNRTFWREQIFQAGTNNYYPYLEEYGGHMHLLLERVTTRYYIDHYHGKIENGVRNLVYANTLYDLTGTTGDIGRLFYYDDFWTPGSHYNDDALVFMCRFTVPNPWEIGFGYIYQTAPDVFNATSKAGQGANYTSRLYGIDVWEMVSGTYAFKATCVASSMKFSADNAYSLSFWDSSHVLGDWDSYDESMATANQLYFNYILPQVTTGSISFTVKDPAGGTVNSTCIQSATTLDQVMACIDAIPDVGQSPDDPNPPGTNYPPDGKGVITRFNLRMYIWLIGWVLVFLPWIAVAYKTYPFRFYMYFFICEIFGLGLLWSIGSI